ncbi:response regulator, partial [Candidatus Saccharibacteria bacterium]|nr:response regulator [Candidatus Saccharibacteria bacterium]
MTNEPPGSSEITIDASGVLRTNQASTTLATIPTTPPVTSQKPIKVLCIEDEHFISELYERALTKAGYEVKVVVDGVEGLKEAQTDTYDIILLDIMIPNLRGTDILKQLRDPAHTPHFH